MGVLVVVFGFGILLLLALVAVSVWSLRRSGQHPKAAGSLAAAMGWRELASTTAARPPWYGAMVGERRAAMRSANVVLPAVYIGRVNTRWVLRMVLAPQLSRPLGVDISYRHEVGEQAPFTQRFDGQGSDQLPADVRAALEQVIAGLALPPAQPGAQGDHPIRLRVVDRARVPALILPADILGDAPLLIIHECQDLRITPAGVQQILDALASLAGALEHWAADAPPSLSSV